MNNESDNWKMEKLRTQTFANLSNKPSETTFCCSFSYMPYALSCPYLARPSPFRAIYRFQSNAIHYAAARTRKALYGPIKNAPYIVEGQQNEQIPKKYQQNKLYAKSENKPWNLIS